VFLDFELLGPNWNYFKFCQIFYKLIQTNFKPKTNPFPTLGPNPAGPTWAGRGHLTQTPPRAPHLGTELNIVTAPQPLTHGPHQMSLPPAAACYYL